MRLLFWLPDFFVYPFTDVNFFLGREGECLDGGFVAVESLVLGLYTLLELRRLLCER